MASSRSYPLDATTTAIVSSPRVSGRISGAFTASSVQELLLRWQTTTLWTRAQVYGTKQSMDTITTEARNEPTVQELARQLLRRLMAERNLRTTGISKVLNVESHTVRRMLNGSRAISLDEMVLIARLGGYSLDAQFGLGGGNGSYATGRSSNNEGLGRVFQAIAELLSAGAGESRDKLISQYRNEPAPRDMAAHLSAGAQESLARIVAGVEEKRKRGRPRKIA
jgi:hypothetical protein